MYHLQKPFQHLYSNTRRWVRTAVLRRIKNL